MVGQKRCGVKILPARLNTCSTGADVLVQRIFLVN